MEVQSLDTRQFCTLLAGMTDGMSSVREIVASLKQSQNLDTKEGISLLSLKHHVVLSYLQSLVLLSTRRTLGSAIDLRSPSLEAFSTPNRSRRGSNLGDIVDYMIEGRVTLEKIKTLESRMRYQIEKLIGIADEPEKSSNFVDDLLTFRPNPQYLNTDENESLGDEDNKQGTRQSRGEIDFSHTGEDEIYRPPRVAPMPYREKSKSQARKERPPVPSALASLSSDPSRPHTESTSGLGTTPSLASGRATYLKRLNEFEEDNFSRVMMKKSDAKRRARDEEDLALGGGLSGGGGQNRRRAGGLEDEFGEVLRSVGRVSGGRVGGPKGDGYEELRKRGRKADILERSRKDDGAIKRGSIGDIDGGETEGRAKKRSRFELEAKTMKKKLNKGKPF